jgi:hypothetical protein
MGVRHLNDEERLTAALEYCERSIAQRRAKLDEAVAEAAKLRDQIARVHEAAKQRTDRAENTQ